MEFANGHRPEQVLDTLDRQVDVQNEIGEDEVERYAQTAAISLRLDCQWCRVWIKCNTPTRKPDQLFPFLVHFVVASNRHGNGNEDVVPIDCEFAVVGYLA